MDFGPKREAEAVVTQILWFGFHSFVYLYM